MVWFDTAGAARSIAEEKPRGVAALASEYAGKLYGLKAVRTGVQNEKNNFTRFLAISRNPLSLASQKGTRKTSVVFGAQNVPGALARILGVFASRGIDLSKIESRPDPSTPFEYRFYLDFSGGTGDAKVKQALRDLHGLTKNFRVLGSYPAARLDFARSAKRH